MAVLRTTLATLALALLAFEAARAAPGPVTLAEIRSLLLIGKDDTLIASEIHRRGTAFPVTHAVLRDVRSGGAGRETLLALQARLDPPTLFVTLQPEDSELFIDGTAHAREKNAAPIRLRSLKPGDHTLVVRKVGYREQSVSVVLVAGEESRVSVALVPAPGQLKVTTDIPDVAMQVDGVQTAIANGSPIELAPGGHLLHFDCPVCAPASYEVVIAPGETFELSPELSARKDAIDALVSTLLTLMARGEHERAVSAAETVLRFEPDSQRALAVRAEAYYLLDEPDRFAAAARAAVKHGATLQLPVRHRDTLLASDLEDSTLTIDASSIRFEPEHEPCEWGRVAFERQSLQGATVVEDNGYLWLALAFPGKKRPEVYRLADRAARLEPAVKSRTLGGVFHVQYGGHVMRNREAATTWLNGLKELLLSLRE